MGGREIKLDLLPHNPTNAKYVILMWKKPSKDRNLIPTPQGQLPGFPPAMEMRVWNKQKLKSLNYKIWKLIAHGKPAIRSLRRLCDLDLDDRLNKLHTAISIISLSCFKTFHGSLLTLKRSTTKYKVL